MGCRGQSCHRSGETVREMTSNIVRVGDQIETKVRQPSPQTFRLQITTAAACNEANRLLADPKSGWVLCRSEQVAAA